MGLIRPLVPGRGTLCRISIKLQSRFLSQAALTPARATLSKIWVPTGGVSATEGESGHGKLIRAGFLRQSQSGIFQLLPLGVRVQDKIEELLNKHMQSIGASRLSLSSFTSEELWRKSGRLDKVASELFRLTDRKDVPLMLSPTHEEEITALVASTINSYKDLPLRLYQITRKYRDEIRPRHGLLRSREFLMKDLYTFDVSQESALDTYQDVSAAYRAFFSDLKLPILVAEASSGDMGGDHSHEYHLANPIGEDTVATCSSCGYTANDEVAMARSSPSAALKDPEANASHFRVWRGISKDRKTLVNAWYPHMGQGNGVTEVNIHAVKAVVPDIDASISDPLQAWSDALKSAEAEDSTPEAGKVQLLNVIDSRLVTIFEDFRDSIEVIPQSIEDRSIRQSSLTVAPSGQGLNLLQLADGDGCPRCESGSLKIQRALELGHTFLLGTRYSKPLEACVTLPQSPAAPVPVQMGCYGVGISRIFGTVAEHMADERGLMWPRAIAPFEVVVIPTSGVTQESLDFYDSLTSSSEGPRIDAVLDDRKETFGWKMRDADMTGYPVVVILGKAWREKGTCEVQCRTLSLKENVSVNVLSNYLKDLLAKL